MSLILLLNKLAITVSVQDTFMMSDSIDFAIVPNINVIYQCAILPPIAFLQAISPGQDSFASTLLGYNFLTFTNTAQPNKIVGTYSTTIFNTEIELQGNQPKFVNSSPDVSVYNPIMQYFDGNLTMVWLEANAAGRLDLKYGDTPVTTLPPLTSNASPVYIRPYVNELLGTGIESNIPLNKITLVDSLGDSFDLTTSEYLKRGFNIQLPAGIKSVQFTQLFKINNYVVNALLTTVPTQNYSLGSSLPMPINGAIINIYAGKTTSYLATRAFTDEFGKFSITIPYAGEYLFEIEVASDNIFYQQQIS